MIFGYARTSTLEQKAGFEAQIKELTAAGAVRIYQEQVSSVAMRAELDRLLSNLRAGDVIVVTKLDRLARNMADLISIVGRIEGAGASLRILAMNLDTTTATGKLILNVLGSIAQWERSMMLERQREGIAKARAEKKYKGRRPHGADVVAKVLAMHADKRGPTHIARELGIGRTSVHRIISENR